ncbi:DUF3099 domain-containing protein [Leucobacter insecticola]|uniref:DUF3099 domain-containing protein n=1 Tax=Leucobacter insecticola TaxID=2714934 RepID=A0A6G8FJE8_9MICO|nr:DUF3099 domain-containing protein [Leucobacter insecticola]QIM16495.1 DUF3099 domain-containing protein [Leucobacter insecticola]
MAKNYSVTSAGVNPAEDRAHRMRMYFMAMSLRVLCIGSLFWVRGWWILLVGAGAVFLPWFAVMIANAVAHGGEQTPEAPDPLQLQTGTQEAPVAEEASEVLLVVDVDPERRSSRADAEPATEPAAEPAAEPPTEPPTDLRSDET